MRFSPLLFLLCAGWAAASAGERPVVFVGVTVVPMDEERLLGNRTVIVRGGRIAAMGPTEVLEVPAGARVIDGKGRYLMPGLADMHVHTWPANDLFLYVANGVTTIRNMSGLEKHLVWQERIARGEMQAPTLHTTGRILDGRGFTVVASPEDAARIVAEQKQAGYEAVKVYSGLSREVYDAVVRAAAANGLPFVGHVPPGVGLLHALGSGQSSIEHLSGYMTAAQSADSKERGDNDWSAIEHFDETRLPMLARLTRQAGTWNCVTLVTMRRFASPQEAERLMRRPEVRFVAPASREGWDPATGDDLTPEQVARFRRADAQLHQITRALHAAKARLLLGTDAPNPHVVPGFAIHEELAHLVRAGLSPYEALRAGTRDAAEFLGQLEEFGTVAVGRRADLILLEANPLEDVGHVRQRVGVMLRGRWFPEAELRKRLEEIASEYEEPPRS